MTFLTKYFEAYIIGSWCAHFSMNIVQLFELEIDFKANVGYKLKNLRTHMLNIIIKTCMPPTPNVVCEVFCTTRLAVFILA